MFYFKRIIIPLYYKYQKGFSGENYLSMEHMDMLTFMKGIEYLDIQAFIEEKYHEDNKPKQ